MSEQVIIFTGALPEVKEVAALLERYQVSTSCLNPSGKTSS